MIIVQDWYPNALFVYESRCAHARVTQSILYSLGYIIYTKLSESLYTYDINAIVQSRRSYAHDNITNTNSASFMYAK